MSATTQPNAWTDFITKFRTEVCWRENLLDFVNGRIRINRFKIAFILNIQRTTGLNQIIIFENHSHQTEAGTLVKFKFFNTYNNKMAANRRIIMYL